MSVLESQPSMKTGARQLWGSDAWRQRSMKPDAIEEWKRISFMAQAPAECPSGALGSRLGPCPEAAPEAAKPAKTSPTNSVVSICLPVAVLFGGHCCSLCSIRPPSWEVCHQDKLVCSMIRPCTVQHDLTCYSEMNADMMHTPRLCRPGQRQPTCASAWSSAGQCTAATPDRSPPGCPLCPPFPGPDAAPMHSSRQSCRRPCCTNRLAQTVARPAAMQGAATAATRRCQSRHECHSRPAQWTRAAH